MAWAIGHLADTYSPLDICDVVREKPELLDQLDEPVAVVRWLDVGRALIRSERKLNVDVMAAVLDETKTAADPLAAATALAMERLEPWAEWPEVIA
jgi:hypothetical protein